MQVQHVGEVSCFSEQNSNQYRNLQQVHVSFFSLAFWTIGCPFFKQTCLGHLLYPIMSDFARTYLPKNHLWTFPKGKKKSKSSMLTACWGKDWNKNFIQCSSPKCPCNRKNNKKLYIWTYVLETMLNISLFGKLRFFTKDLYRVHIGKMKVILFRL